jgi:hypothetical protein
MGWNCSGGGGSTLSPSNLPTVTGVTLSLNPPGVGATSTAAGSATLSNGTFAAVSTGYTSDALAVATVTDAGVITGVSIGDVTISVDYKGFRASKRVRVLPNYGGTFVGSYTITSCADTGGFAEAPAFCSNFSLNSPLQIQFLNTQSLDLTTLSGQFMLGAIQGNGTGVIAPSGALTYSGTFTSGTTTITVQNFNITSPQVNHMTGQFQIVWTDTTTSGNSVWTCTMQDATRTSSVVSSITGRPPSASLRDHSAAILARPRR